MTQLYVRLSNLAARLRKEEGQTMAEYGVILAVITVGIVIALTALSGGIETAIDKVVTTLKGGSGRPAREPARHQSEERSESRVRD
jgi:Flp pilus assembly pilin Flp